MNVFPASPAAKGAQLRIKRLFSGQSLSLSTHFNASGGKKKHFPRQFGTDSLRSQHCSSSADSLLKLSCFSIRILSHRSTAPYCEATNLTLFICFSAFATQWRSTPLRGFTTGHTFQIPNPATVTTVCIWPSLLFFSFALLYIVFNWLFPAYVCEVLNIGTTLEKQIMHFKAVYRQSMALVKDNQFKNNESRLVN